MPYSDQLEVKEIAMSRDCLLKASRKIRDAYKKRQAFFAHQVSIVNTSPCVEGRPIVVQSLQRIPPRHSFFFKFFFIIIFLFYFTVLFIIVI